MYLSLIDAIIQNRTIICKLDIFPSKKKKLLHNISSTPLKTNNYPQQYTHTQKKISTEFSSKALQYRNEFAFVAFSLSSANHDRTRTFSLLTAPCPAHLRRLSSCHRQETFSGLRLRLRLRSPSLTPRSREGGQ